MEILSIDANQKLANLSALIGRNPQSWDDWYCLKIHLKGVEDSVYQDCLIWMKSIVESYLHQIEGRVFCCSNKMIHILGKTGTKKIMHQTGQQICDLIFAENAVHTYYSVYDLAQDGFIYAQKVFEQADDILSTPSLKPFDVSECHTPELLPQTLNADKAKILLVEDDAVTRWMVCNALKNECDFVTASTANKAFSLYSSHQPDLVLLDINLPDGSGYNVLQWIMRNDPGAKVVMFSGNDNLDNISSALEQGASGFIAKPFLKEDLLHYIGTSLCGSRNAYQAM